MTGDGVNDVLALKDADIGVSMGSGSEATRAVAQIVLLNNSFATLPSVVAEGRRVIGNITRVATLFLTKTVYSVLLAILVVCWQVEYPFLPRHLTLLSTLTIGVPAFFQQYVAAMRLVLCLLLGTVGLAGRTREHDRQRGEQREVSGRNGYSTWKQTTRIASSTE